MGDVNIMPCSGTKLLSVSFEKKNSIHRSNVIIASVILKILNAFEPL